MEILKLIKQKIRKIYIAGHRGMVGSSIVRALTHHSPAIIIGKSRSELNLIDQSAVRHFFETEKPDEVYMAAAKVGGIHANNSYPADFIYENLMVQANIIEAAFKSGVKKLLFLGSSCIYPKMASQPIPEKALMTGPLEPTNEPYAIAKIAGIKLCESYNRQYGESHGLDFRTAMPTNLYGPGDNYHLNNSHVIPGLIRRFHESKINNLPSVTIWGTGNSKREFLYVDDLASACVHIMNLDRKTYLEHTQPMMSHVNIGYGEDLFISDLARLISDTVGYVGNIVFDSTKPDGTPKKLMDSSLIRSLGWAPKVTLREGLAITYRHYLEDDIRH